MTTATEYFAAPGLNSTKLKLFHGNEFSPRKAVYDLTTKEDEEKECYKKGRAVHAALEFNNNMPKSYIPNRYPNWLTNEAKSYRAEGLELRDKKAYEEAAMIWKYKMAEANMTIMATSEYNAAKNMADSVWSSCPKNIQEAIQAKDALREHCIFIDGMKAMLDLIKGSLMDYKSTRHNSIRKIINDAYKLGYHIQAYHYTKLAKLAKIEFDVFKFIYVSSVQPYEVVVMPCSREFMNRGEDDWNIAKERYDEFHLLPWDSLPGMSGNKEVEMVLPDYIENEEIKLEIDGEIVLV